MAGEIKMGYSCGLKDKLTSPLRRANRTQVTEVKVSSESPGKASQEINIKLLENRFITCGIEQGSLSPMLIRLYNFEDPLRRAPSWSPLVELFPEVQHWTAV